jgi:hypothetical protein
MQKCLTIYSNIRTTHKYGNYLQMKIEKYITTVCTYICKNLSTTRYKQASYFSKNVLNNLFNSKHVPIMYHSDTVHRNTHNRVKLKAINTNITLLL